MQQLRTHILFLFAVIMIGSLFFSRTLLALVIPAFVLVSFADDPLKQVRTFFSQPLLWAMSLLFLLPFISGAWSNNKQQWQNVLLLKAPLFLFPVAFASSFRFTKWHWNVFAIVFLGFVTGGSFWSASYYISHTSEVNAGYLQARSLITPLGNDHVRFSLLVFIAIVTGCWMYYRSKHTRFSSLFLIIATWLVIYLHILAARTGLLCLYTAILIVGCFWLWRGKKAQAFILLLLVFLTLPFTASVTVGSFQNKWKYFQYEWPYIRHLSYLPGANDVVRVISIKGGWEIMKKEPLIGCGFGDLPATTHEWYDQNYPGMLEADKILPSSEYMIYGAATGIPGLIIFGVVMLITVLIRSRYRLPWLIISIGAALSLLTDIGLEVQYGVFIYSFILLWWWKWIKDENA